MTVYVFRPWVARLFAVVVAVLTFGIVRLDAPRVRRVPRVRLPRRALLSMKARRQGRRDGRLGIPRPDERDAPPEVWRLKQQGDAFVRSQAATWAATDARLEGEALAIDRSIAAATEATADAKQAVGTFEKLAAAKRRELAEWRERDARRHAEDRWRISSWFYWPALVVIFLGELPLNAVAFQVFDQPLSDTRLMTIGMAAVLVLSAHGLGILWRRNALSGRDRLVAALLVAAPAAVIVAVAVVREAYLAAVGADATLDATTGMLTFVVINIFIYVGACALSYLHHDPEGVMIKRAARKVWRAEWAVRRRRRRLERVVATRRWLETKRALWDAARKRAHRRSAFLGRQHKHVFEGLMQSYWASNRIAAERRLQKDRARAQRRGDEPDERVIRPRSFEHPPAVEVPAEFADDRDAPLAAGSNGHAAGGVPRLAKGSAA